MMPKARLCFPISASYPIKFVLSFVLFSMLVNLAIWIFIYEMRCSHDVFLDPDAPLTTGNMILDGIINGLFVAGFIALLSFVLVICILHKFKRIVTAYLYASFIVLVHTMPIMIIKDFYAKYLGLDDPFVIFMAFLTASIYLLAIALAYFTDHSPPMCRQILSALNCSFTSVYYLRILPRHTIWFLLVAIVIWDVFAVNSSFGPLKLALQNAKDYNANVLQFLMFTTKTENDDNESEDEDGKGEKEEDEEMIPSNDEDIHQRQHGDDGNRNMSAYDALRDPNLTSLGLGDMIIYNLLVGKAAMSGSWLAVVAAIIGIIVGVIITLSISAEADNEDEDDDGDDDMESGYLPALPLPIILGIIAYCCGLVTSNAVQALVLWIL